VTCTGGHAHPSAPRATRTKRRVTVSHRSQLLSFRSDLLKPVASAPLPHCVFPRRSRARLCYKWRECSVRLNEVCTLRQFTCIVNYQRMWTTRGHFTYPLQRGTEGRHGVVLRSNHQRVRYDPSQEEEAYCSNKSLPYHIRPLVIDQAVCNWVRCKSQGHKRTAQHDSKECQNRIPTSSAHQPERTAAQRRCQLPAPMRDGAQRQGCLFGLHVCLERHRGALVFLDHASLEGAER
jgi:hypothetical protein